MSEQDGTDGSFSSFAATGVILEDFGLPLTSTGQIEIRMASLVKIRSLRNHC